MKPNLYKVPLTITVDAAGFVQHPTIEVSVLAYNEEEAVSQAVNDTRIYSSYTGGHIKLIKDFNK